MVRVWVPDRPGALGAVASRIGAVGGDLIGIDILERGGGRAIDELVVELPDDGPGAAADHRGLRGRRRRRRGRAARDRRAWPTLASTRSETAARAGRAGHDRPLLDALAVHASHDFQADWAVVVDLDPPVEPAGDRRPAPPAAWLGAFVAGSRAAVRRRRRRGRSRRRGLGPPEAADLALVLGRRGRPFRARERRQLAALARIADHRWAELVARSSSLRHR